MAEVLWSAARAEDGRGEPTALRDAVLRWSGASSIAEVSVGVHRGLIDLGARAAYVPELFALADGGDPQARRLVTRQGEEIGLIAGSRCSRTSRMPTRRSCSVAASARPGTRS